MKPPRYLLREYAVKQLLRDMKPGKFLEFGYGNGNMLLALSQLGYYGDGYDFSDDARLIAQKYLLRNGVSRVRLLSRLDENESYDYIFMFEVIGYFQDIRKELGLSRKLLRENGKLILSFVRKGAAYSSKALGNQRFFSCNEIREELQRSGYKINKMWNYGYPLANMLSPFLNMALKIKDFRSNKTMNVQQSGLFHENVFMVVLGFLVNRITIYPLAKMQLIFKNTNLGNGYIVLAEKI